MSPSGVITTPSRASYVYTFRDLSTYSDRAYCWVCFLIKDIGRRLPLDLRVLINSFCQGQQRDVNQFVHGNYKKKLLRGTKSEGCIYYQVCICPLSGRSRSPARNKIAVSAFSIVVHWAVQIPFRSYLFSELRTPCILCLNVQFTFLCPIYAPLLYYILSFTCVVLYPPNHSNIGSISSCFLSTSFHTLSTTPSYLIPTGAYYCQQWGAVLKSPPILVRGPPLNHVSAYPLRQQRVVCCFTCCLRYAKIRFTYRCVLCTWVKTVRGTHVHDHGPRLGYPQHLLSKTVHSFTHETQVKRRSKEGGELQATLRDMWRKS